MSSKVFTFSRQTMGRRVSITGIDMGKVGLLIIMLAGDRVGLQFEKTNNVIYMQKIANINISIFLEFTELFVGIFLWCLRVIIVLYAPICCRYCSKELPILNKLVFNVQACFIDFLYFFFGIIDCDRARLCWFFFDFSSAGLLADLFDEPGVWEDFLLPFLTRWPNQLNSLTRYFWKFPDFR